MQFNFPRQSLSEVLKEQQKLKTQASGASEGSVVTLADIGVTADMVFFVSLL